MFKFVVLFAMIVAASAKLTTFGRSAQNSFGGNYQQQNNFGGQHQASATKTYSAASSDDVHAEIKSFHSDVHPEGFNYAYDTTNGIAASASGDAYGVAHGDFGWVSPEGVHVAVQYVADENGYQPTGDILPTPPPIPDYILRSLEYIRTHPPKEEVHHSNNYGRRF